MTDRRRRNLLLGMAAASGAALGSAATARVGSGGVGQFLDPGEVPLGRSFGDELACVLLGTGIPMPSIHRSRPAVAIAAGGRLFLVDCGAGTVERLLRARIPPWRVMDVFFTHHHNDHNSGFSDFLISSWGGGANPERSDPLRVYGPTNTRDIIGKLMVHLEWDISLRVRQNRFDPRGAQVVYVEQDAGTIYEKDGVTVTVFLVDHGIAKPAVGYRFEYRGRRVVISGDTRPCQEVVRQARGADLLVHEAYSKRWLEAFVADHPNAKDLVKGVMGYHSSTLEAAEVARSAGVDHLVFTHLMPSPSPVWYFERDWATGVRDVFRGHVTVGRDLMVF